MDVADPILTAASNAVAGTNADALRHFLAGRDVACPGCGYNVRDLTAGVCPECGQGLEVSLRLQEPRQAALIAGLVGLSSGAGLGGLLLVYWAILTIAMGRGAPPDFVILNAVGFAVHGIALLFWIRNWNRIRRLSPTVRRLLVIACWTLPLAFVVVFARVIR